MAYHALVVEEIGSGLNGAPEECRERIIVLKTLALRPRRGRIMSTRVRIRPLARAVVTAADAGTPSLASGARVDGFDGWDGHSRGLARRDGRRRRRTACIAGAELDGNYMRARGCM